MHFRVLSGCQWDTVSRGQSHTQGRGHLLGAALVHLGQICPKMGAMEVFSLKSKPFVVRTFVKKWCQVSLCNHHCLHPEQPGLCSREELLWEQIVST